MSDLRTAAVAATANGPSRILDLSWGFARTATLVAALDLGVFTAIARGHDTLDGLAAELGVDERGLSTLLAAVDAIGMVERGEDGRYHLAHDAAVYLDEASPRYLGDLRHAHHELNFRLWPQLADTVREGAPRREIFAGRAADVWTKITPYLDALGEAAGHWIAGVAGDLVADRPRVLDAGCGYGGYGRPLVEHWNARLVGVDRVESVAASRERADRAALGENAQYRVADLFVDDWDGPYDVVLLSNVAHGYEPAAVAQLLDKAHAALADGGLLLIYEIVPDDLVDPVGAFFALEMLLTSEGTAYDLGDYVAKCEAAQLSVVRTLRSPTGPGTLIVASRGSAS